MLVSRRWRSALLVVAALAAGCAAVAAAQSPSSNVDAKWVGTWQGTSPTAGPVTVTFYAQSKPIDDTHAQIGDIAYTAKGCHDPLIEFVPIANQQQLSPSTGSASCVPGDYVMTFKADGTIDVSTLTQDFVIKRTTSTTPPSAGTPRGPCPGSLVESRRVRLGGHTVATLHVYYQRSGHKNCARLDHAGTTRGVALRTRASIAICANHRPTDGSCHVVGGTTQTDDGTFTDYAGPVTTHRVSASGRCIAADGAIWIDGHRHDVRTHPRVGHCRR